MLLESYIIHEKFFNSTEYQDNLKNKIHYYKTLDYIKYSIPVSKNFAARLSSGDFIFNLDIDNYLDNVIDEIFKLDIDVGVFCNVFGKGIYGRVGCHRHIMERVGGYDESFLPAASHEGDLMERCKFLGYSFKDIMPQKGAILNSKEDTVRWCERNISWEEMELSNRQKAKYNILNKIIFPNNSFINCRFVYNFNKEAELNGSSFFRV